MKELIKRNIGKTIAVIIGTVVAGLLLYFITTSLNNNMLAFNEAQQITNNKLERIRTIQLRQTELYQIKLTSMNHALEQIHDGEYITLRNNKQEILLKEWDFKNKGAGGDK